MPDPLTPDLVRRAVEARDRDAVRALVAALTPVVQAGVARVLLRRRAAARGRPIRQEVEDLAQDVFEALLADGGRRLLAWDPERGTPSAFFGLIAERHAHDVLDSRRRSPWADDPAEPAELDREPAREAAVERLAASREALRTLGERLDASLGERDRELFRLMYVEHRDDEEVRRALDLGRDALYQARRRLLQRVHALAADLMDDHGDAPGASP